MFAKGYNCVVIKNPFWRGNIIMHGICFAYTFHLSKGIYDHAVGFQVRFWHTLGDIIKLCHVFDCGEKRSRSDEEEKRVLQIQDKDVERKDRILNFHSIFSINTFTIVSCSGV